MQCGVTFTLTHLGVTVKLFNERQEQIQPERMQVQLERCSTQQGVFVDLDGSSKKRMLDNLEEHWLLLLAQGRDRCQGSCNATGSA